MSGTTQDSARWGAAPIAALAVLIVMGARALTILAGGEDAMVRNMADDSFYYFVLARNFAELGVWTFDGVAPASGFHVMWAYLLAGVFALAPDITLPVLFVWVSLIGLACFTASAWFLARTAVGLYGPWAAAAVVLAMTGGSLMALAPMGMETPLLALAAGASVWMVFGRTPATDTSAPPIGAGMLSLAFMIGMFGALSRSDFGLLPACLLAGKALEHLAVLRTSEEGRAQMLKPWRWLAVWPALALFAGAVAGTAAVMAHTWLWSGDLVQNSALMKAHWSSLQGHSALTGVEAAGLVLGYGLSDDGRVASATILALAGLASLALTLRRGRSWGAPLAGALAAVGYGFVYSHNSAALQIWYAGAFFAPAILLLAPLAGWLGAAGRSWAWRGPAVSFAVILLLATSVVSRGPLWGYATVMRDAGLAVQALPDRGWAGAWNAGIVAWFAGERVVNLDGLVNDDVYPYVTTGRLADYVRERELTHLADFAGMFGESRAARGGYADGTLQACTQPVQRIGAEDPDARWRRSIMTVYEVDQACLAAAADHSGAPTTP